MSPELYKELLANGEVAKVTLSIDRLPDDILNRMRKVFSKHSVKDVREWGALLMKNYHFLYSIEKPMNLSYVKTFANTNDLINKTPNIHESEKAKRDEEIKKHKEGKDGEVVIDLEKKEEGREET